MKTDKTVAINLVPSRPYDVTASYLTYLPGDKKPAISQTMFSDAFCEAKVLYFDWNFNEVCS